MSPIEEEYVYFRECLTSLNKAWSILNVLIKETKGNKQLHIAAYHMVIIEYAKPFTHSFGITAKRHLLTNYYDLPYSKRELFLHDHLLALRNQVLAHSDIGVKDPKLYLGKTKRMPLPLITTNYYT